MAKPRLARKTASSGAAGKHFALTAWGALFVTVASACAAPSPPEPPAAKAPASPAVASPAASPAPTAASPVATAAAAAASPAATAVAAASPLATQAAPAVGTAVAASPVRIVGAQLNPVDTTLSVQNAGSAEVDMSGWRLRVGSTTATLPANTRVAPGGTITLHTGSGTSTGSDVYLGQDAMALLSGLQPGASVSLVDGQGQVISEFVLPQR